MIASDSSKSTPTRINRTKKDTQDHAISRNISMYAYVVSKIKYEHEYGSTRNVLLVVRAKASPDYCEYGKHGTH